MQNKPGRRDGLPLRVTPRSKIVSPIDRRSLLFIEPTQKHLTPKPENSRLRLFSLWYKEHQSSLTSVASGVLCLSLFAIKVIQAHGASSAVACVRDRKRVISYTPGPKHSTPTITTLLVRRVPRGTPPTTIFVLISEADYQFYVEIQTGNDCIWIRLL